jgi:hypothetical protein
MHKMKFALVLLLVLNSFLEGKSQSKLTLGPYWEELFGDARMFPIPDGGMWIVSIETPDPTRSVRITRLDKSGTQVINVLHQSSKSKILKGYELIGCVSDQGKLNLITAQRDKSANTIAFQLWPVDQSGQPTTPTSLWNISPEENLGNSTYNYWFQISDDDSHFAVGRYDCRQYASFTSSGTKVIEGDLTSMDRLTVVKRMAVSGAGAIGMILFTNQNEVFVTVKQDVTIFCHQTDGQLRTEPLNAPDGYISPNSLKFAFRPNGATVLAGFTFDAKN